jgi:hypothetical protein
VRSRRHVRKFHDGDRVRYVGPIRGRQPCVPVGTLGGELRVAWDHGKRISAWNGVWPDELEWAVIETLASLENETGPSRESRRPGL